MGISFHNLQQELNQLTFVDYDAQKRRQKLSRVIDYINRRYGNNSIIIGVSPTIHKVKEIVAFGHIPKVEKIKQ